MPSCTKVLGAVVCVEAEEREPREEAMPAHTASTLRRSVLLPGLTMERASRAAVTTTWADSHCWREVRPGQGSCGRLKGRAWLKGLSPTTWRRNEIFKHYYSSAF